ncbi:hypothetical protein [Bacteriovorax sp. Seq25_V]|uniref:hypothetical protein n=1 Tax=Bacteriovorax sp. Seq25_V TaxID=1201288 RepID=UPI00038A2258|nr:hypothetical protein [Bacteriovorax sp. Seq25_V]EQC44752.1 hypothetical protein M900_0418 [Bacteriovorax sp. Seq25_V]
MKKIVISALALSTLSMSAYASKARLLALGDEVEDNFYVMDSRYIFTNASYANEYANQVFLEWGGTATTSASTLDQDADPKAQGGFLKKSGAYTYGAYLGNESNVSSFLRILASSGDTVLNTADNQLDLFIAGGSDMKWGANFVYAASEKKETGKEKIEDSAMALRLGAHQANWDGFANISLNSEAENKNGTGKPKFEGKLGFQLGGSYMMNDVKFHGAFKKFDWEQTLSDVKTDGGFTRIDLGFGKNYKVADEGSVFARVQFTKLDVELKYAAGKAELNRTVVPLVLGYEGKATSWLTLRGSVSHNLHSKVKSKNLSSVIQGASTTAGLQNSALGAYNGSTTDGESTIANSTTVNAGATLEFGALSVDGFIGTTGVARNSTSSAKNGVLATDNLLTRVGMTYKF